MASNTSRNSEDSDVFFAEQLSNEPSPQRNNSPNILNSTELSGTHTKEMPSISSVASAEADFATLDVDSNERTMPYGFRRELPNIPPSLNDLNPPPNPFNILATMTPVKPTGDGQDDTIIITPSHRSPLTHCPSQHHP